MNYIATFKTPVGVFGIAKSDGFFTKKKFWICWNGGGIGESNSLSAAKILIQERAFKDLHSKRNKLIKELAIIDDAIKLTGSFPYWIEHFRLGV